MSYLVANSEDRVSHDEAHILQSHFKRLCYFTIEPRHDKTNKVTVRLAKTQISLGIRPVWSESSLCTQWVAKDPSFLHADNEDVDQTGRMPRLVWVFAGHTLILLVLSCRGSIFLKFAPIWYGCRNTFNSKKKKTNKKNNVFIPFWYGCFEHIYCKIVMWLWKLCNHLYQPILKYLLNRCLSIPQAIPWYADIPLK